MFAFLLFRAYLCRRVGSFFMSKRVQCSCPVVVYPDVFLTIMLDIVYYSRQNETQ